MRPHGEPEQGAALCGGGPAVLHLGNYHHEQPENRLGADALSGDDRSRESVHPLVSDRSQRRLRQHLRLLPLGTLHELGGRDPPDAAAAHDPRAGGQGEGAARLRVYLVRAGGDQPGVYGRPFFQRRDGGRPALPGNF